MLNESLGLCISDFSFISGVFFPAGDFLSDFGYKSLETENLVLGVVLLETQVTQHAPTSRF
jgi:hypothetical protein